MLLPTVAPVAHSSTACFDTELRQWAFISSTVRHFDDQPIARQGRKNWKSFSLHKIPTRSRRTGVLKTARSANRVGSGTEMSSLFGLVFTNWSPIINYKSITTCSADGNKTLLLFLQSPSACGLLAACVAKRFAKRLPDHLGAETGAGLNAGSVTVVPILTKSEIYRQIHSTCAISNLIHISSAVFDMSLKDWQTWKHEEGCVLQY
jgi:hypothetical protein